MSLTRKHIYGASPRTARGKPVKLGGDPNGDNFLYCSGSSVFIRNVDNPLKCDQYTGHTQETTVAMYCPSRFYIASADKTGLVKIWDTVNEEHITKYEYRMLGGAINDIAWTEDSKRLAAVGEGNGMYGSVIAWDTGSSVGEISGTSKALTTVDIRKTRPYRMVTGSEDFTAGFFEGPPFKFKHALKEHTRFINCARYSRDGSMFATVGSDMIGFIFDGDNGALRCKLADGKNGGHTGGIYGCSWSDDGRQLLTASADKTCKIFDVETGKCVTTLNIAKNPSTDDQQLGCLWQNGRCISVSLGGNINYLDPKDGKAPRSVVYGHNQRSTAVAFDRSSKTIYTGGFDSAVRAWGYDEGSVAPPTGAGHKNGIVAMTVCDGNLVTVGGDNQVKFTTIKDNAFGSGGSGGTDDLPTGVSVSGKKAVAVAYRTGIAVFKGGRKVGSVGTKFQVNCVDMSPDEKFVVAGGEDKLLHLFSHSDGKLAEVKTMDKHRGVVTAVAFSKDGSMIGSADANRDVIVWDAAKHTAKVTGWCFHSGRITCLAWNPDNVHLATGGLDRDIYIWNVNETTKRIKVQQTHAGGVSALLWPRDSSLLSVGSDNTLKQWKVKF